VEYLATTFRALSDETRLRILNLLSRTGELCVCDIEDIIGGPQTKISRHLAYLRRVGLVQARKKGLWALYSIPDSQNPQVRKILECINGLFRDASRARDDQNQLIRNVQEGCCATFASVKPGERASFLQKNKG